MQEHNQLPAETEYALAAQEVYSSDAPAPMLDALGPRLMAEFATAELERRQTEERWLKDLRQYKGQYDPETIALIGPQRSKAFVRKTRVKVKTTDSRVADLLFPAGSEKNWTIDTTPVPSISKEQRAIIAQNLSQMSNGQRVPQDVIDKAVLEIARESAKKMSKVIEDQLVEARYKEVSIKTIHSGHLYGTGIMKGPLVERKIRTRFVQEGNNWVCKSETYVVPFVDYVPVWRFYPDMSASEVDQCRYIYERHQMTKADMVSLSQRKSFNKQRIIDYIKVHPQGEIKLRYFDNELRIIGERTATQGAKGGTYEVLERWGWVDGQDLANTGVKIPEDRIHETFFSNIWLLPNGEIIKAVLQPINGVTWPYHLYYFDKDETSIFGEGLSTVMRDDQTMLNAATRLMLDNGAITAGPQLEVTPSLLASMDKVEEVTPWKVWMRNTVQPGVAAVRAIELPSRLAELSNLADRFDRNADEVTAIPRYMTGENATNGAAGTSSGLSMLMGAANIVIKDLVTSWDEGVTRPFLTALYRWNMQFHKDNAVKGDFDVKARGTASLVAKEVRTRQLNEFATLTGNEMDAPFIKRHKLNLLRAEANELSDVVKTEDEVKQEQESQQAKMMAAMQLELQATQLAELKGKVSVLSAQASKAMADIDLIRAKTVETNAATVYSALQAGGVATSNPTIAPAGDEILRSAGWKDATPDPTIAQLDSQPVQQQDGTMVQMGKGQSFQQEPRGNTDPVQPGNPADGQPQAMPGAAEPQPATGEVGLHQGIETPQIDGA